jgi:hypothetical protein
LIIDSHAASPPDYKGESWKGEWQAIPGKMAAAFCDEGGEGVACVAKVGQFSWF